MYLTIKYALDKIDSNFLQAFLFKTRFIVNMKVNHTSTLVKILFNYLQLVGIIFS